MNFKYCILMWTCCSAVIGLYGQQLQLKSTPAGLFVSIENSPANIKGWVIERERSSKLDGERWVLATITSEETYRGQLIRFNELFPDGACLSPRLVDSLWYLRATDRPITHPAYLLAEGHAVVDLHVLSDQTYTYRLISPDGKVFDKEAIRFPSPPRFPQLRLATIESGEYPLLRWSAAKVADIWSAKVFRQDPVNGRFQRVAAEIQAFRNPSADTLSLLVRDTTIEEYGYWRYYIQATDRFGNTGPAAEVGHILWLDAASRPSIKRLTAKAAVDRANIALDWEIDHPHRINAIQVFRSQTYGGRYELRATLSPNTRSYNDGVQQGGEAYYYYLKAIDLANQSVRSAIVAEAYKGELKVTPPRELSADMKKNGVLVSWNEDAREDYGYLVYRAKGHRGELIPISNLLRGRDQSGNYLDTSTYLQAGEMYSYAVRAVSGSGGQSDYSDRISIQGPGEMLIPAPRNFKSRSKAGAIVLHWEALDARAPSVIGYHLYRRLLEIDTFERITRIPLGLSENRYVEPLSISAYEYGVRAISVNGSEGLMSRVTPVQLQQARDLRPEQLQAARIREGIQLSWTPLPLPQQSQAVQVYRSAGNNPFLLIEELTINSSRYLDRTTVANQRYRYYLQVKDKAGNISLPTSMINL